MKWLPLTFKCAVLHLSICTLLYVSFSLNTSVTCAAPHLVCHNIFLFPTVIFYRQNAACPPSNQGKMRGRIKRGADRDAKLHYGYYAVARYLPAAGWAAHAPVAPNEPAWKDLCGNKRLCLSAIPDPSTRRLCAPPALSVTDQEQSAGPFLVAWLDWGRSLQLAGLSVTGGGGPQRLSLADTSDRQGTASADRFIKWHFLQLGLQKWGLGFVKSPSLEGPLCVGLDQSFVVMTNFLIWAVWNQLFFSSLASLLLTASPLACALSWQRKCTL